MADRVHGASARDQPSPDEGRSDPAGGWGWLHTILDLPWVGGPLCFGLAVAPGFLVVMLGAAAAMLFGFDWEGAGADAAPDLLLIASLLVALAVTRWWLRVLERGAGVTLCLPIPVLNIPIRWFIMPVALVLVVMPFIE